MNIFSLFEALQFDKSAFQDLSNDTILHFEKEILEKNAQNIDAKLTNDLLLAVKNYSNEFLFVINTREWYNYFAQTNYSRNEFPFQYSSTTNEQKMRDFVVLFLEPSLTLFSTQNLQQNQFEELVKLLENKSFIPEKILTNWNIQAMDKMDFALARIHETVNQSADIGYIKNRSFYDFLSHFKSIELDEKVRLLSFKMDKIYKRNSRLALAHETLFAISYYQSFEEDLSSELLQYRSKVEYKKANTSSSSIALRTILSVALGIIALLGITIFVYKITTNSKLESNQSSGENNTTEPVLDRYYTNMKPKVDSLNRYLVDYDKSSCLNLNYLDNLKTGDNPFKFLFNNGSYAKIPTGVTIHNQSEYDVVLFEKAILFDSIKMPQQAVFVRSKQSIELTTLGDPSNRIFSFYAGKKLATFHAENELPIVCENSVEEPRFKELASNAKSLLSKDYFLQSDLFIKSENGTIALDSKNLIEFTKPNQ